MYVLGKPDQIGLMIGLMFRMLQLEILHVRFEWIRYPFYNEQPHVNKWYTTRKPIRYANRRPIRYPRIEYAVSELMAQQA